MNLRLKHTMNILRLRLVRCLNIMTGWVYYGPMNYEVRAFSWEDINNYFDQIVEMQRETFMFHYPEKEPKIEYIVAKLRELRII